MKLFNSLSKQVEVLRPSSASGVLTWYSCGPTVYDKTHLGHARNYVQLDIMQRVIEWSGLPVLHTMGVTDVDDKILQRSRELGEDPRTLAQRYEKEFVACMDALGVRRPCAALRVTEHMDEIIAFVKELEKSGFAYQKDDGVHFDVGRLGDAYWTLGNCEAAAGAEGEEGGRDFALWKRRAAGTEGLGWDSPWGHGRPGWHIECSAMIDAAFGHGRRLDVHAGGIDLSFPHHNNEIAQTCAHAKCSPKDAYGLFVHVGHLHIEGRKMSKSLKNFVSVDEFLQKGGSASEFRMFCLLHHYRDPITLSDQSLDESRALLERFERFVQDFGESSPLDKTPQGRSNLWLSEEIRKCCAEIRVLLCEDLQTPAAMHKLSDLTVQLRKQEKTFRRVDLQEAAHLIQETLGATGVVVAPKVCADERTAKGVADVGVELRQRIRDFAGKLPPEHKREGYALSDWARQRLADAKVQVEDSKEGSKWRWIH